MDNISNLSSIFLSRIRELQNISWARQSLDEATELIKENKHQQALTFLNTAQDFDPYMPQIYLTKGCALANLGRYKEGIVELKKSLSLDPENITAQKYLEKVQKKYDEELKLMYTKQAKQLNFDRQKLEMKNAAALNFNAQDNNYKFVGESDFDNTSRLHQQLLQVSNININNILNQQQVQEEMSAIQASTELNVKRTHEQLNRKDGGTEKSRDDSSSSSQESRKKRKKDKKKKNSTSQTNLKKDKKDKGKDKKKKNTSS